MIYDMYGFPEELYEVQYPAPGDPEEAGTIQAYLTKEGLDVSLDTERGLDHGIWSMLVHLYPEADIPVIPVSIAYDASPEFQYRLGGLLRSFARERNILIIFSGNIVHNLRMLDFSG
jgi:4,5-DOPA dioxygenase extradiol